jgi:hypothetical protein
VPGKRPPDYPGVADTNWDKFDSLFTCPASVTDDDLRTGYQEFYVTARKECEGLDMSAAQIMRTSVMLNWFFKHQATSRKGYGEDDGYQHPGQEKDAILAWEQIAKTWDDVRLKSRPRGEGGLPPEKVRDIFLAVLSAVPEAGLRAILQDKFVDALATA